MRFAPEVKMSLRSKAYSVLADFADLAILLKLLYTNPKTVDISILTVWGFIDTLRADVDIGPYHCLYILR